MAAETKAPRVARSTTNMEDAAAAMRARRLSAGHVDPDLIDNALADLEVADTFLDASERYWDEINEWVKPKGYASNRTLHAEVCRGLLIMQEGADRIGLARGRLKTALDQAYAAMPRRAGPTVDGSSVAFHAAWVTYVDAFNAANAFYLLNFPGDDGDDDDFEPGFDKYCSASFDAAEDALLTPALTIKDIERKQVIIDQHDVAGWSGDHLGDVFKTIVADALRLAGGAA